MEPTKKLPLIGQNLIILAFGLFLWFPVCFLARSVGWANVPWTLFAISFLAGIPTGFAIFSGGSFYRTLPGQLVQGVLSIGCLAMIIAVFWIHGWKVGVLDTLLVFSGSNIGLSLHLLLRRCLTEKNPENLPPASKPTSRLEIFSAAEAESALARLKAKAAAMKIPTAAPPPSRSPEVADMSAKETRANPDQARYRFDAIVADLRLVFTEWVAAKEEQFEQVLDLGWSGEHENAEVFLRHLEQERERLRNEAAQTGSDISSTASAMELEGTHEKLEDMK